MPFGPKYDGTAPGDKENETPAMGINYRTKKILYGWAMLTPSLVGLIIFTLGAVLFSFGLSFFKTNLLSPAKFVGFKNYISILSDDPLFGQSLFNTFYFAFANIVVGIVFSMAIALLLNRKQRGTTFFRSVYFVPFVISLVAVATTWKWIYHEDFGMANYFLKLINLPPAPWINDAAWAMPSIILMSIWRTTGYRTVIFLAGLQAIPDMYYESAMLDGANAWQRIRYITLPLLSPTTIFVAITSTIFSFQVFGQVYILTQGGPANSTSVAMWHLYVNGFRFFRMGYSSAIAWILFAIIFVFTILQWKLVGRRVYGN